MKKLLTVLTIAGALQMANAQDGNNICVWNAMNTYNSGGGPSDLEGGIKCSDLAAVNESTVGKWKTWFYRGQLYTLAFQDTVVRAKYPTAGIEAANAFKKLGEINDPKFKEWEDANRYANGLAVNLYNVAADAFQSRNYTLAGQYFYLVKELGTVVNAHKGSVNVNPYAALKNAVTSYDNAGNVAQAQIYMEELYKSQPDSVANLKYLLYVTKKAVSDPNLAANKAANQERLDALLIEGLAKYPKDASFLSEKINSFLSKDDFPGALNYVNALIESDPKNSEAYVIKGLAYDKMGKKDSVIIAYQQALAINPNNVTANNNLGKAYIDEANVLIEQMNKLGSSDADNKKYAALKAQTADIYKKGFPFIEKAHELDPKDASIERSYKQIKLKMQQ